MSRKPGQASISRRRGLLRAQKGDPEAIAAFIEMSHRFVFNVMFRVTQAKDHAHQLTESCFKRLILTIHKRKEHDHFPAWLLETIRDTCFEELPSQDWQGTLFVQARDELSDAFDFEPLDDDFFDGASSGLSGFDTGFKSSMTPAQLLTLELRFIEGVESSTLADVLGVTPNVLNSFLFSVFDSLGRFTLVQHAPSPANSPVAGESDVPVEDLSPDPSSDACPPEVTLGLRVLETPESQHNDLETAHAGCPGCRTVIRRCRRLIELFRVDSRLSAKPHPQLHQNLVEAIGLRRKAFESGQMRLTPPAFPRPVIPPEPPPVKRVGWSGLVGFIGLMTTFLWFSSRFLDTARFRSGSTVILPESSATAPVLGHSTTPYTKRKPLYSGDIVHSGRTHKTLIELADAGQVLLGPDSAIRLEPGAIHLLSGEAQIRAPATSRTRLLLHQLVGSLPGVRAHLLRERGIRTEFVVSERPFLLVVDGTNHSIDPGRRALYDEVTGKVTILDVTDEYRHAHEYQLEKPFGELVQSTVHSGWGHSAGQSELTTEEALLEAFGSRRPRDQQPVVVPLRSKSGRDRGDAGPRNYRDALKLHQRDDSGPQPVGS